FGDVRYNFIRWIPDADSAGPWAGLTQLTADPRDGRIVSATIDVPNTGMEEELLARLDFWLTALGANPAPDANGNWPEGPPGCQTGQTMPILPGAVASAYDAESPLYGRIQAYLGRPVETNGYLAPSDFAVAQSDAWQKAYAAIAAREIYADPAASLWTS